MQCCLYEVKETKTITGLLARPELDALECPAGSAFVAAGSRAEHCISSTM